MLIRKPLRLAAVAPVARAATPVAGGRPRGATPPPEGPRRRESRILSRFAVATIGVLAVTIGVATHVSAAGAWSLQASANANNLQGVSFVDANHGWAVGSNGIIQATADEGATWSVQTSGSSSRLACVSFVDASHGWAVGAGGTILATTDGGATWSAQTSGTSTGLTGVSFVDASHGWAVGDFGTILATADGGATWSAQTSGTGNTLNGLSFVDANHGWAVGFGGVILVTADAGASWSVLSTTYADTLFAVSFVDANRGWAVGGSGRILATVDGGASWVAQPSGATMDLSGVSFADASHGWAVGIDGTIVATADGGATWSAETSGTNAEFAGVSFVDANHGWAVGQDGRILAFVNAPPSGTLTMTPSSGPSGTVISADSVTPCPAMSTNATIYLKNNADTTIASGSSSSFDASGDWAGTLAVPAGTPSGPYFVTASCFEPSIHGATDTQNYAFSAFNVSTAPPPPTGTVQGRAFNLNSSQLAGVAIALTGGPHQVTGSRGAYAFTGVGVGSHTLSATFKGRACHANSKTGPTSPVTVMVSGGRSTTVTWFCSVK
jgi:photosystem II stability/assembly factor-like uncharacterized protein